MANRYSEPTFYKKSKKKVYLALTIISKIGHYMYKSNKGTVDIFSIFHQCGYAYYLCCKYAEDNVKCITITTMISDKL